ncbi:MAG: rod shape-determining protein MreC [Alphaproteobacteria bacterium]|nr:MAG: rod shape-determining protein MreC [Alphaproteobacteria bacterium]
MAPPSSRRAGHSRKAQYSVFTGYVLAAVGAVIGAVLLAISLWRPAAFSDVRGIAVDAVEPVGQVGAEARSESSGVVGTIRDYFRAGSQNAQLRKENELARLRLAEAEAVIQENKRLKKLLGLQDQELAPVVVTRLVGSTASSTRRFAYIGAGRLDGVRVGMPVRSPRGIVGRVLEVSSNTSRVLLLTDSESVLPVRSARDDTVAFAEGRGNGQLRIRLVNLGINPIKKGDLFVTSGAGGYYRPGVAVAIATEVTNDGAVARMVTDPSAADFVAVEPIWQPELVAGTQTPASTELGAGGSGN